MQPAPVRQPQLRARPAQEALLDAVGRAADRELERDLWRRTLVAGWLKAPDRLGLRAMALEQDRLQRGEQRRLAHLVGADQQVEAIGDAGDPHPPVELAELLELERDELHRAASLRCSV